MNEQNIRILREHSVTKEISVGSAPEETGDYIVLLGDPVNGFIVIGLFDTKEEAQEYAETNFEGDVWVDQMVSKEEALE